MRAVAGIVQGGVFGFVIIAMMVMAAVCSISARFRLERRFGFADRAAQAPSPFRRARGRSGSAVCRRSRWAESAPAHGGCRGGRRRGRRVAGCRRRPRSAFPARRGSRRRHEPSSASQFVAAVQVVAAFEEDAGLGAGSQRDFQAAALAFVVGERHRVGGGGVVRWFRISMVRTGSNAAPAAVRSPVRRPDARRRP